MGEATAHIAALMPEKNFLCCEVHEPGVGALLKRIGEQGLHNIRIVPHDAVEVMDHMLPRGSLAGMHIFFPDPWHKTAAQQAPPGPAAVGRAAGLHACAPAATSTAPPIGSLTRSRCWKCYRGEPQLANTAAGLCARPDYRPLTKFENRGLKLGHGVWDLVFRKR